MLGSASLKAYATEDLHEAWILAQPRKVGPVPCQHQHRITNFKCFPPVRHLLLMLPRRRSGNRELTRLYVSASRASDKLRIDRLSFRSFAPVREYHRLSRHGKRMPSRNCQCHLARGYPFFELPVADAVIEEAVAEATKG